jgi:hypothetical protein
VGAQALFRTRSKRQFAVMPSAMTIERRWRQCSSISCAPVKSRNAMHTYSSTARCGLSTFSCCLPPSLTSAKRQFSWPSTWWELFFSANDSSAFGDAKAEIQKAALTIPKRPMSTAARLELAEQLAWHRGSVLLPSAHEAAHGRLRWCIWSRALGDLRLRAANHHGCWDTH